MRRRGATSHRHRHRHRRRHRGRHDVQGAGRLGACARSSWPVRPVHALYSGRPWWRSVHSGYCTADGVPSYPGARFRIRPVRCVRAVEIGAFVRSVGGASGSPTFSESVAVRARRPRDSALGSLLLSMFFFSFPPWRRCEAPLIAFLDVRLVGLQNVTPCKVTPSKVTPV